MTEFLGPQHRPPLTLNAGVSKAAQKGKEVWVHPRVVAQGNIPKEVRQVTSECRDLHLWLGAWPWGLPTCLARLLRTSWPWNVTEPPS